MSERARWVPKLRFPEFRGAKAWKACAGSDLFHQVNERNAQADLPVLAITQEHGAIPRELIDYHVSVTDKSLESYKVVRPGDFIISLRSFQGGIEYSQYRGICSPAYVVLRRRGEGSNAYFKHYLKTEGFIQLLTKNLEGLRDGKMISYKQFSELRLPVPAEAEQQKIADCLSSLDELIAAQERKMGALKDHKNGLMDRIFPRHGETQPQFRFPEFRGSNRWSQSTLGACFEPIRNGFVGTATPYYTSAEGVLYLQGRNVKAGRIEPSKPIFVTREFHERQSKSHLKLGDLLMVQSGHVGECAAVSEDFVGCNCHALIILTPSRELIPEFFVQYFYAPPGKQSVFQITTGNTIKHILSSELKSLPLLVPSLKEQQRIANFLAAIDQIIITATLELATLKTHKQALMQQLFPSAEALEA